MKQIDPAIYRAWTEKVPNMDVPSRIKRYGTNDEGIGKLAYCLTKEEGEKNVIHATLLSQN